MIYGLEERELLRLTGNHAENPTLDLPCREVFARGQKDVRVIGPVAAMSAVFAETHRRFWPGR